MPSRASYFGCCSENGVLIDVSVRYHRCLPSHFHSHQEYLGYHSRQMMVVGSCCSILPIAVVADFDKLIHGFSENFVDSRVMRREIAVRPLRANTMLPTDCHNRRMGICGGSRMLHLKWALSVRSQLLLHSSWPYSKGLHQPPHRRNHHLNRNYDHFHQSLNL